MRPALTLLLFLLGVALGCGSAGMSSSSSRQNTSPSNISVTLQPVQPVSPVQVVASATSPYPIAKWQIAVDSNVVWQETSAQPQISQSIPVSAGQHQITATATNSTGDSASSSVALTLPGSAAAEPAPTTLSVSLKPLGSSSPATVTAVAQGPKPFTGWALYVDGNLVNKQNTSAGTFTQTVEMTTGQAPGPGPYLGQHRGLRRGYGHGRHHGFYCQHHFRQPHSGASLLCPDLEQGGRKARLVRLRSLRWKSRRHRSQGQLLV